MFPSDIVRVCSSYFGATAKIFALDAVELKIEQCLFEEHLSTVSPKSTVLVYTPLNYGHLFVKDTCLGPKSTLLVVHTALN